MIFKFLLIIEEIFKNSFSNYNTMAGYDKSLDVEVFSTQKEFETTKIVVSVMQYNEGQKKIQISRDNLDMNTGEWKWSKLGRLNAQESQVVVELIQEASKNLE